MTTNNIDIDPYSNLFTTECSQTFNITPYTWQVAVGRALIQASVEKTALKYLCVRPTCGGKSLVFNAASAGITVRYTVSGAIKGIAISVIG